MNKKAMVLRDIIFIIIIFAGIIALSSVFVSQMGDEYSNENMTSSYDNSAIGLEKLNETTNKWEKIGESFKGGFLGILIGTYEAAGEIITQVLLAPATLSDMIVSILTDFGVDSSITSILGFIITATLYILIIFVIISAFLQGGKM